MRSLYESIISNSKIGVDVLIEKKTQELIEFFRNNWLCELKNIGVPKKLSDGFDIMLQTNSKSFWFDNNNAIPGSIFPTHINKMVNQNNKNIGLYFKHNTISDFSYFPKNCNKLVFQECDIKSFDNITDCFSLNSINDEWDIGIFFEHSSTDKTYKLNNINFKDISVNISNGIFNYAKDIKHCKFSKLYIKYSVADGIEFMKNSSFNSNPYAACARHIEDGSATDTHYSAVANNLPGLCELIKNNDITELVIFGVHEKFIDGRLDNTERIHLDKNKQQKLLKLYKK